jgi:hypothetical protein
LTKGHTPIAEQIIVSDRFGDIPLSSTEEARLIASERGLVYTEALIEAALKPSSAQ